MGKKPNSAGILVSSFFVVSLLCADTSSAAGEEGACSAAATPKAGLCLGIFLEDMSFCNSCVVKMNAAKSVRAPRLNWSQIEMDLDEKFKEGISKGDLADSSPHVLKRNLDILEVNTLQGDQEALATDPEFQRLFFQQTGKKATDDKSEYYRARWKQKESQLKKVKSDYLGKLRSAESWMQKQATEKPCAKGVGMTLKPVEGFYTEEVDASGDFTDLNEAVTRVNVSSENYLKGKQKDELKQLLAKKVDTGRVKEQIERKHQAISAARKKMEGQIAGLEKTPGTFCSAPILQEMPLEAAPTQSYVDLNEEDFFEDNKTNLNQAQQQRIRERINQALKPAKGCKKIVKSVNVKTSASALANTGPVWGTPDKRFNFRALSEERAGNLAEMVSSHLRTQSGLSGGGLKIEDSAKVATTNSNGENGDGTSGPCPYEMREVQAGDGSDSGKKKVVRKEGLEAGLKKAKFARIHIETVDQCGPDQNSDPESQPPVRKLHFKSVCFQSVFECSTGN
jgi:hypothetical protein